MRDKNRNRKYADKEGSKYESEDSMRDKKRNGKGMDKSDRKIVKSAISKSSKEGTHNKLCSAIYNLFDRMTKEENIEKLKKMFVMELYEMCNGKHFDETTGMEIVAGMENVDGTTGEHFSMEECQDYSNRFKMGPKGDGKYNEWDWYVIMNMMWSDYSEVLGNKVELYLAMTDAYFNGPDEDEGKAWTQMSYKLFEEEEEEEEEELEDK